MIEVHQKCIKINRGYVYGRGSVHAFRSRQKNRRQKDLLLYWEEYLRLPCGRTENGHRYYTNEDIRLFSCIKELLEQGIRISDLKEVIPDILHTKETLKQDNADSPEAFLPPCSEVYF